MRYDVFITINPEGATVDHLAKLVLSEVISIGEVDPCCRGEVAERVIQQLGEGLCYEQ